MAHPFKSERELKEYDSLTYRQIAEENRSVPKLQPIVVIKDRILRGEELDEVPPEGSEFTIKYVPAGGDLERTGEKVSFWGTIAFIAGLVLTFFVPPLGYSLMILGGGTALLGATIAVTDALLQRALTSASLDEPLPQIHGARNTLRPWGSVPVIIGTHRIAPYYAAKPFTSLSGNDQYLTLLFAVGYNPLTIENMKIGDTPLASFAGVTSEVIQDGSVPTLYPKTVFEEALSVLLKYNVPAVRRTQSNVAELSVDIAFPQGLCTFDDGGDKTNRTVNIEAYYKKDTDPDESYALMGYFNVTDNNITDNKTSAVRKTVVKDVSASGNSGAWDIKLIRNTADSTDTSILDKCYWTTYRSVRDTPPVSAVARAKIVMIGLKIKATDQLSGVVDTFNLLAKGKYKKYDGGGSGSAYWSVAETRNPAAAYLYALQGTWNPKPVPDSLIDWATLESWYDWCQTTNVHYCDMVIDGSHRLEEVLSQIAIVGRATFTMRDGKYSVVHDTTRSTVVQLFTPRNSWDFIGEKEFKDAPHAIRCQFINENLEYKQDERIVYDDGYNEGNATRFEKVSLLGVTDPDQVWKMGRYLLAVGRLRPEMYSLNVDMEHLVCTRGDLVRVMHDVPLLGIKPARIKALNMSGPDVASVVIDETCTMELGKSYAVRYRRSDGLVVYKTITTVEGNQTTLTFTTAVPPAEAPAVGDLLAFGEAGLETRDMIVITIEMQKDLAAKLYLMDYSPAIFTADSGTIPDWDPGITIPTETIPETPYEPVPIEVLPPYLDDPGHPPSSPTYGDLQDGYNAGGGTTTPTPVTVFGCEAIGIHSITLWWDIQDNLTNLDHYELQVSSNQTNWYALRNDGVDWKGSPNPAVTVAGSPYFTHENIPPGGTEDDPTPVTLYYHVRRKTKAGVPGSWSANASATTKLIGTKDIEAVSISAAKLEAVALEAQFANIAYVLTIGFAGTGTPQSPNTGDRRVYLDEDELTIQQWSGSAWVNKVRIGGGSANTIVAGQDENIYHIFGKAFIGYAGSYGANDEAAFGHIDCRSTANAAFVQHYDGRTYVNAKTGRKIYFRINNLEIAAIDTNGLDMGSTKHIYLGDLTYIYLGAANDLEIVHNGAASVINQDGTGTLQLQHGGSTKLAITSDGAVGSAPLLHVEDRKTAGTSGGTFTSGSWYTRALNTVVTNGISGASLSSNQIILPAGTYEIEVFAPACHVQRHQCKLRNLTNSSDVLYGSSEFSNSDYDTNSKSHILGRFSIAGTKTFEIWHMCSLSYGTRGRGVEVNFGTIEIYTQVWIKKVG